MAATAVITGAGAAGVAASEGDERKQDGHQTNNRMETNKKDKNIYLHIYCIKTKKRLKQRLKTKKPNREIKKKTGDSIGRRGNVSHQVHILLYKRGVWSGFFTGGKTAPHRNRT